MEFSQKIADEICSLMAEDELSLRQICALSDMPSRTTVYKWLSNNQDFANQYARAREAMLDGMAEEILEISDDAEFDTITDERGNLRANTEWVCRSRLKVDSRKWLLSKLLPKKYGDRQILDVGDDTIKHLSEDRIKSRITDLIGKARIVQSPGTSGEDGGGE